MELSARPSATRPHEDDHHPLRVPDEKWCCLDCEIDRFSGMPPGSWGRYQDAPDTLEPPAVEIELLHLYVDVVAGLDLTVRDIASLFSADHINRFLTRFLPVRAWSLSASKLRKLHAAFKQILGFFHEEGLLTSHEYETIKAEILDYKVVRDTFRETQAQQTQVYPDLQKNYKRRRLSGTEYDRAYQARVPSAPLPPVTQFEQEYADILRLNILDNIAGRDHSCFHSLDGFLASCRIFAGYVNWITRAAVRASRTLDNFEALFYQNLTRFFNRGVFLDHCLTSTPSKTLDFVYEVALTHLEGNCRRCDYACLWKE